MSVRRLVAVDVEYRCELAVWGGVLDVVRADVEGSWWWWTKEREDLCCHDGRDGLQIRETAGLWRNLPQISDIKQIEGPFNFPE